MFARAWTEDAAPAGAAAPATGPRAWGSAEAGIPWNADTGDATSPLGVAMLLVAGSPATDRRSGVCPAAAAGDAGGAACDGDTDPPPFPVAPEPAVGAVPGPAPGEPAETWVPAPEPDAVVDAGAVEAPLLGPGVADLVSVGPVPAAAGAPTADAAAAWFVTGGAGTAAGAGADLRRRAVSAEAAACAAAAESAARRRIGASRCCQPGLLSLVRVWAEACCAAGGRAPARGWCAPPSPAGAPGGAPAEGREVCRPVSLRRTAFWPAGAVEICGLGVVKRAAPVAIGPAARTSEMDRTGTAVPVIRLAKPPGT